MATSGSKDFTRTRDQIIDGAIRILGHNRGGKIGLDQQRIEASEALNMLFKSWQAEGIGLWVNTESAVFLSPNEEYYSLGSSGDHASAVWVKTELSADAASGAAAISVDSIEGISDEDNVGIVLSDGTIQWTTVNGTPSGSTITLTAVLTGAASEDGHVYTYTTRLARPIEIIEARVRRSDDTEIVLIAISRDEYMALTSKDTTGTVVQYYYDPQLDLGRLYVWPVATDLKEYIKLTARVPFDDFDAATDNAEMPVELLRALKWNLAADLSLEYETELEKVHVIRAEARKIKEQIMLDDKEYTSVFFTLDDR